MKNKLPGKASLKYPVQIQLLLGVVIMTIVAALTIQSDMAATQQSLAMTAGYIKEQCNRYARIELAAETKSLIRIIESSKQIVHQIEEEDGCVDPAALEYYAKNSYVTGVVLLDADGTILSQYHENGQMPEPVSEALKSAALLDTANHPEKRYAVRFRCADRSEIDLAATAYIGKAGIIVAYYHTSLEYIESFDLSIASLLSGYNMENNGTIAVSNGEKIVASNDGTLVGQSTNDVPILRKIKQTGAENRMTNAYQSGNPLSRYFGLMERGRDYYVYTFLPERNAFQSTPRALLYTLIAYVVVLLAINRIRWRAAQRAQAEFAERLQHKNQQLSVAVQEADRANAAKTSFLSRMSHDIRTPLNGIIGLLEIDAAHPDDRELVDSNREKMRVSANHLLSLLNDVLQMSKLESGEIALGHEPIDLNRLAAEVMTIVSQRAAESGITMENDRRSEQVSAPWVYGSPLHLRQIFLNIYTNCIKYNKLGGSITTLFQCVEKDEKTVTYRWTISDTGIGMSEEFLGHIFDPFTQEKTDARSIYQGTGLGMAIVKGLVEQMHGSIEVGSTLGVGSTFTITIPFEIAESVEVKPARRNDVGQADIRGLRLMLAEDNDLNAEIAKMLLEDAGVIVTGVGDGRQAVSLFREKPAGTFDVILMDIMMPVMDGLTATKTIRALDRPDARTIPIIAMTANAFEEDAQKCLAAGMNAHLAKPLDIGKLIATIAQYKAKDNEKRQ